MKKYAAVDLRKYAQQGEEVEVVKQLHDTVWICRNQRGVRFPTSPELLSDDPVEAQDIAPPIRSQKESKKPLTQAQKLQYEYLNAKK